MLLAVSMRVTHHAAYSEPRDSLAHDWAVWLDTINHQPIMLPNRLKDPKAFLRATRVEGLILTGGDSIIPSQNDDDAVRARVATEHAAIDMAIEDGLPIIGVCRGFQMLNQYFGGQIVDNIVMQLPYAHTHVAQAHFVELLAPFDSICKGSQLNVNSYHDEGVVPQGLGSNLKAFALSDDGLIEGFVHTELPILAVQWHPERNNPSTDILKTLMGELLADGAFWKDQLK